MLIHREGWLYSGKTPAFFSGQSGCYCCTPAANPVVWFYGVKLGAVPIRDTDSYIEDTWTSKTDGPTPARSSCQSASLNGIAYVFGGTSTISPYYETENNQYVHSTDTFTTKSAMTASRYQGCGLPIDGKAYSFAGNDAGTVSRTSYQYDASADSWATKTDTPTPARKDHTGFALGTDGYIVGGSDGGSTVYADNDQYSPGSNAWTSKTSVGTGRLGATGFAVDGIGVFCIGNAGFGVLSKLTDKYTASSDSWAAGPVIDYWYSTPARYYGAGNSSNSTSPGFVSGGLTGSGAASAKTDKYNASTDLWSAGADAPTPARWLSTATESA
jgi:hypothetical protein